MIWNLLTIILIFGALTCALYLLYGIVQLARIEQSLQAHLPRIQRLLDAHDKSGET